MIDQNRYQFIIRLQAQQRGKYVLCTAIRSVWMRTVPSSGEIDSGGLLPRIPD